MLHSLNLWKASGLDETSAMLLKECANELAWPPSCVFNLLLATGKYPAQMERSPRDSLVQE